MIQLVVFDIDGTLYDEHAKAFPVSNVRALQKLRQRGVQVAIATGRPPRTTQKLHAAKIEWDYLICANGHLIQDENGRLLRNRCFSPDLAQQVYDYCCRAGMGLLWKYPEETHVYLDAPAFAPIYGKNGRDDFCFGNCGIHLLQGANGGCLACDPAAREMFNAAFSGSCRAVDVDGHYSDLMLWNTSKGTALHWLLAHLGLSAQECIAFGDNLNDLEILSQAGIGVCMGNGVEALKQCSDYVTDAVDAQGIEKALRHFGLID